MVSNSRSGETFFFFSFFQSMAIFSPINVAKVKRHRRRRGRSAQIQKPGGAHHLNLYWLCTLALEEPVMCVCHFPGTFSTSNLPEGGMKGTEISGKHVLHKHLRTNCLRRLAIGKWWRRPNIPIYLLQLIWSLCTTGDFQGGKNHLSPFIWNIVFM